MTTGLDNNAAQRVWVVSSPRTASHLLLKVLNYEDQDILHDGYFFLPSLEKRYALQDKPAAEWTEDERKGVQEVMQQGLDRLQNLMQKSEEGKKPLFIKEHALLATHPVVESDWIHGKAEQTKTSPSLEPSLEGSHSDKNKTWLTDEFVLSWKPVFLIRHPAMTYVSLYRMFALEGFNRADNEPNVLEATMHWQRSLYDFHASHYGKDSAWPIVLDADDVMTNPKLLTKFAGMVGLDPTKLKFQWEKVSQQEQDQMHAMRRGAQGSINNSIGVDTTKVAGDIDLGAEALKWKAKFGEEKGTKLERLVRESLGDYEYLRSKKLV